MYYSTGWFLGIIKVMTDWLYNKNAKRNYDVLETVEAGVVLRGFEVKSIKAQQGSLKEAFVVNEDGEMFLVKAHVPAYQPANAPDSYDPYRKRKLLLNRREIDRLLKKKQEAGLTLIPIRLYNLRGKIKLEIALARGKKKHDKRQAIKTRDTERDLGRTLKNRR